MGNYVKTLLIGCGGSGIRTLTRLNELLSSNPNYRNDVRETISYLVIDTSREDLEEFKSKIESQMGETGLPNIATAHITEGFNNLNQIVRPNIDKFKGDSEILDKMKQHWMFNADGEPFRGNQIKDLEQGAGQCCQVSYLATWNYMPKLEATLSDITNEIRKRNSGADSSKLQVFLIAGFAGGTGRGSWQLVAFKVRQFLEEQGIQADINAVFFDASCYPNVSRTAKKEQRENMLVNSYTAMSELAAWLRLKESPTYYYTLPYLDNSEAEVIKVYDDGNVSNQSPVLRAFLIFGSNGRTGDLEHNKQYHNMAATALYSMVVYPDVVNAVFSNDRMNIGSFGATTFEVDTYHLHSFFETGVQKKFLEKQCADLTSSGLSGEVDQLIGSMHTPEKDTFLSNNCLWLPESLSAGSDGVSLEYRDEDKILSLLQKMVKEKIDGNYVSKIPQKNADGSDTKVFSTTTRLKDELRKDKDPKIINPLIDNLLQLSALDEDTLAGDLNDVLSAYALDKANLVKTLDKAVLDQFAPESKDVSLARCILFTAKLKGCFEKYIDVLNQGIIVQGMQDYCTDVADVATSLKESVVKAFTEDNGFLGLGKKFNDKEIELVCSRFQYCMYAAIFFKLKPVLIEFYQRAVKHLNLIAEALDTMVAILKKTNLVLDQNLEPDFGKLSYDEIIGEYFIDAKDSDSVLKSIPPASALKNVYYRQLKPIMNIDEINELLSDSHNVRINRKPVLAEIGKQLQNLLAINDPAIKNKRFDSSDEALKTLPKELCKLIAANVHLEEKVGKDKTFMDEHFSFEEVLNNNIKCWNKLLKEASSVQLADLKDRFRDFLGVTDDDYDEEDCLEKQKILKKIILSLVYSCKPWIQIVSNSSSGVSESLDCRVLLPLRIDNPTGWAKEIGDIYSNGKVVMRANINCPGINDNTLNLPSDRIVVFNAEVIEDQDDYAPMDKVQNLTLWRRDSAVNALLVLAEGPRDGETAWFKFDQKKERWVEKARGMAYVSPIFDNEPLKSLRWHPWVKETTVSMEEAQLAKAHMALFYAFLGNGIPEDAAVKSTLVGFNCEKPLLSMANQDFSFNYSPRVWNNNKMDSSTLHPSWGGKVPHGINHVVDYLCGKGDSAYQADGGNRFQESKDAGKKLCDALNTEAEVFFTNVFPKLSDADKTQLVAALYTWMSEQYEKSTGKDKEDRPYWKALREFTGKESENRGVVLK